MHVDGTDLGTRAFQSGPTFLVEPHSTFAKATSTSVFLPCEHSACQHIMQCLNIAGSKVRPRKRKTSQQISLVKKKGRKKRRWGIYTYTEILLGSYFQLGEHTLFKPSVDCPVSVYVQSVHENHQGLESDVEWPTWGTRTGKLQESHALHSVQGAPGNASLFLQWKFVQCEHHRILSPRLTATGM